MAYIVKNISRFVVNLEIEDGTTLTIRTGESEDLDLCCTRTWIDQNTKLASLISGGYLLLTTNTVPSEAVKGSSVSYDGSDSTVSAVDLSGAIDEVISETSDALSDLETSKVEKTTESITLYVETTGSDTTGNGTASSPFATIEKAISLLPKHILHDVDIIVGEGNFAGFRLDDFNVYRGGHLNVEGTIGAFSPATGNASGTATGGDTNTIIDSGQSWTDSDLIGKLALVGGEYRWIKSNTATEIEICSAFSATASGKSYQIVELKTVLNDTPADFEFGFIEGTGNHISKPVSFSLLGTVGITVQNFDCDTGGYEAGWFQHTDPIDFRRIKIRNPYWGLGGYNMTGRWFLDTMWVEGNSNGSGGGGGLYSLEVTSFRVYNSYFKDSVAGISSAYSEDSVISGCEFNTVSKGIDLNGAQNSNITNCILEGSRITVAFNNYCSIGNVVINDATSDAIDLQVVGNVQIQNVAIDSATGCGVVLDFACVHAWLDNVDINNCTKYGIMLPEGNSALKKASGMGLSISGGSTVTSNTLGGIRVNNMNHLYAENTTVSNNSGDGIHVSNKAHAELKNVTGTGNTGYGLKVDTGSSASINQATTVTGTTSDVLVDATAATYAADFTTDTDSVTDATTFCWVQRND